MSVKEALTQSALNLMFIFLTFSVLTLSTCILLTPLARALAIRKDWYDTPGPLKIHQIPTPRLGGATMMAALLLGTVTAPAVLRPSLVVILALLGVWTAGLVDDSAEQRGVLVLASRPANKFRYDVS